MCAAEDDYKSKLDALPKKKSMVDLVDPELLKLVKTSNSSSIEHRSLKLGITSLKFGKEQGKDSFIKIMKSPTGRLELNAASIVANLDATANLDCNLNSSKWGIYEGLGSAVKSNTLEVRRRRT
jgi:hypothetical protein